MHSLNLGRINFDAAWRIQAEEKSKVRDGLSSGMIFFLEHDPPVITLGRNTGNRDLLHSKDFIESKGIQVRNASRGGGATAHEPGQLVVYFVLPVKAKSAGKFVADITEKIIACLKNDFSIESEYRKSMPGIWARDKKICSIGFDLTGGVSSHGIALNVNNSLETFKYISPCGIDANRMTTMEIIAGSKVSVEQASSRLIHCF